MKSIVTGPQRRDLKCNNSLFYSSLIFIEFCVRLGDNCVLILGDVVDGLYPQRPLPHRDLRSGDQTGKW